MSEAAVPKSAAPPPPSDTKPQPSAAAAASANAKAAGALAKPMQPSKVSALPPKPSGRMSLAKVVKGRLVKPIRVLIYGIEGVGKSMFAAGAPSPIFIGAEDGTSELDVARFPEPLTWADAMEAISELTTAEHDYQTCVIDTLDWLEPLCWAHVCTGKKDKAGKPITDIEGFGYGKGYTAALDHWRQLTAALERMRNARGLNTVLIGHSWIKAFKNPAGDDFDRYEMKLHAKAGGLLREWCDAVLFATHETLTYESNNRVKGVSSGARVVHTERTAAFDAKNRYDLPDRLPLDWQAFAEAVAAHRPGDPTQLRARIDTLLALHTEEKLVERVRASVVSAGDNAAELARIANKLSAVTDQQQQATEEQAS